ncbi:phosphoribosylglycinamide formyltransferase [Salimicrobium jeotgali]|uniref:Phosphoribosylglycinamide formyltransferase n=2 Tax=Salimicrobium TaxID=351195 RepID=K2H9V1_9BACI|nr:MULTISPECIES: phosphoribosylglycinamide formyltransferase [Salimicrobium]AKG05200.1 phosphoribosylglycinamide formyltransferase [Salimicrobium jeotgali]EKE32420.1 phosphoribosylglycinamide formyltransferase [Salimicrobium jeotgali]MBM7695601.1 phosphoribosylglycinamide formyltransferase-1 [Salimicrobium jeotgali]SIS76127.1 phosphoribosylglycinamide formyltransferase-1 [Salimicrobium salexigens]
MTKIAVFASGTGTNFDALLTSMEHKEKWGEVSLLVSDRPSAEVVHKAEARGIEVLSFHPADFQGKAGYEQVILGACREHGIEWIVLAGYMRLIGSTLLTPFEGRIVNVHPSLLPRFPGKHAVQQAFDQGVAVTGVTVHIVDEGMDTGPILEQEEVAIEAEDTIGDVERKIQKVEHVLYPKVVERLVKGEKSYDKAGAFERFK